MRLPLLVVVAVLAAGCSQGGPDASPTATPSTGAAASPTIGGTSAATPATSAAPAPATVATTPPTSAVATPSTSPAPATPTASPAAPTPATPAPTATPTASATPSPTSAPTLGAPATPATPPTPGATVPTVTPTPTGGTPSTPATPTAPTTPPSTPVPLAGAYVAAFRTCPKISGCADNEHEVRLATSDDGASFAAFPNATPLGSGTPDVLRRGGTLYVYNDGKVHRYDVANGTWRAPATVTLTNANGTAAIGLNASAILDDNGSIVLFHLFAREGQGPGCPPLVDGTISPVCTKTFRSATEIAGSDGTEFLVDAGNRATVVTNTTASDPDVFARPGGYAMLVSAGGAVRVLTSPTLRGTYAHHEYVTNTSGHTPAGHYDAATSRYWIYTQTGGGAMAMAVKRAVVASLDDPLPDSAFETILADRGAPSFATNAANAG